MSLPTATNNVRDPEAAMPTPIEEEMRESLYSHEEEGETDGEKAAMSSSSTSSKAGGGGVGFGGGVLSLKRQSERSGLVLPDEVRKARRRQNDGHARIPMGYRTLSIHVYDSLRFPTIPPNGGENDEHSLSSSAAAAKKFRLPKLPSLPSWLRLHRGGRRAAQEEGQSPSAKTASVDRGAADFFARLDYHQISAEEACQRFNVHPDAGLDQAAVDRRTARNGKNAFSKAPSHTYRKILRYLFGDFCSILWIGVIIFFISWKPLGNPNPQAYNLALAIVVLIVIFFQAAFAAFQDWSTQRVMNSIMNLLPDAAFVVRQDGQVRQVPASELVVGDIVQLSLGQKVPADVRLIEASADLKFNRSVLTGEAEEVAGAVDCGQETNFIEARNIALLGTHVCHGSAKGVVVLTGARTVMGRINSLTSSSSQQQQTNLQREITRFVKIIIGLTVTLVLIMLITWLAWLRVDHFDFLPTVALLTNLMSLVVAFIPEGMPIAVAFTLSLIARRMRDAKVLPKSLSVVETLGCVNVICSDKTGTLTQNQMTVVSAALCAEDIDLAAFKDDLQAHGNEALYAVQRGITLCNDAVFTSDKEEEEGSEKSERKTQGNATDVACLRLASLSKTYEEVKQQYTRVFTMAFNSTNKFMLTICRQKRNDGDESSEYEMLVKGAPDVLLGRCSSFVASDGTAKTLKEKEKDDLVKKQERWSGQGQRVIMLCRKAFISSAKENETQFEDDAERQAQDNLTIVAILGILDPPRPEIRQTVADCRRSGARFFMVTGDFGITASAIAKQCGILTSDAAPERVWEFAQRGRLVELTEEGSSLDVEKAGATKAASKKEEEDDMVIEAGLLIEGKEMHAFDQRQWDVICRYQEIVFARTTPEQKLMIVNNLRQRNFVVAVTGDGVNDAPALKAADVGVAMVEGSDVAIEAADLVLMGSFSSIVEGIRLGRLVFQNLQKVISYLLPAGSWSEDWPIILNVFFGCPLPLSSFLMIIICCFTDLACCLTLITEREEFDLLSLPPRNPKKEHLVNKRIYAQSYLFIGTMETVIAHSMFFLYIYQAAGIPVNKMFFAFARYSEGYYGHSQAELNMFLQTGQCVYFVTLVILQWGNLLSVRNKRMSILQADPFTRKERRNFWILLGPLFALIVAIFVTEVKGLQNLFGTASVPLKHWFIPIPLALGVLVMDEVRKLLVRQWPNGFVAKVAW